MTWEEIAQLHKDGFEIGNHTRDHKGVTDKTRPRPAGPGAGDQRPVQGARHPAADQLRLPRQRHHEGRAAGPEGPRASSSPAAAAPRSTRTRRAAGSPTSRASTTRCSSRPPATPGRPGRSTTSRRAVAQARHGKIAVLQFHGVPDTAHDWVSTPKEQFEAFMKYLADEKFTVIALRDLAKYVDPDGGAERPVRA